MNLSDLDGKVTPIVPLNVNPEFSHTATLSFLANDDESMMLGGKQIKEILEKELNVETNKDFK